MSLRLLVVKVKILWIQAEVGFWFGFDKYTEVIGLPVYRTTVGERCLKHGTNGDISMKRSLMATCGSICQAICVLAVVALIAPIAASETDCEVPQAGSFSRGSFDGTPVIILRGEKVVQVFAGGANIGVAVFDVTDLQNPSRQGIGSTIGTGFSGANYDPSTMILWVRSFTYACCGGGYPSHLTAFDLSDPTRIIRRGQFTFSEGVLQHNEFLVRDGRLYVRSPDGIRVFDASNPNVFPVELGGYVLGQTLTPFHSSPTGQYLYARSNTSFYVLDVSNPGDVQLVGAQPVLGLTNGAHFTDDLWFVPRAPVPGIESFEFVIVDVSNPREPTVVGSWTSPESDAETGARGWLRRDDLLYVSYYYGYRVWFDEEYTDHFEDVAVVLNIANPASPSLVSTAPAKRVLSDGPLGVSLQFEGATLFQLNNLGSLVEGRSLRIASSPSLLTMTQDFGYSVDRTRRMVMVFDSRRNTTIPLVAEAVLEEPVAPTSYGIAQAFAVDDLLYVQCFGYQFGDFVLVYSMSDPAAPVLVGQVPLADYRMLNRAAVDGDRGVGVHNGTLWIFDWSDPSAPEFGFAYTSPNGSISDAVFHDGQVLVVTAGGLERIDVSTIDSPQLTGFVAGALSDGRIAVGNERIFVRMGTQLWSTPTSMAPGAAGLVATLTDPHANQGQSVALFGDLLIVKTKAITCSFYDVSDPSFPRWILASTVQVDLLGNHNDPLHVADGMLWVVRNGVRSYDLQRGTSLAALSTTPTADTTFHVALSGDLALVSDYAGGVRVMNVASPGAPVEIGSFVSSALAYQSTVVGQHAFVAFGEAGLVVLDLANPAQPALVASVPTSDLALGIDVRHGFAYVACRFGGLEIFDISVPTAPVLVGSIDTPGSAQSVTVTDWHAFVADGSAGVQIIDIANRSNPMIVGTYNTPLSARQVVLRGSIAFVPDRTTGLIALDVGDPTSPQLLSTLGGLGDTRGMAMHGHLAVVADFGGAVHLVDAANPASMTHASTLTTLGTPRAVSIAGTRSFVADGDSGVSIVDLRTCWARPCPVDLTGDGVLDFFDVQMFLNAYSASSGLADWNNDGVIDFFDVQAFLGAFAASCP